MTEPRYAVSFTLSKLAPPESDAYATTLHEMTLATDLSSHVALDYLGSMVTANLMHPQTAVALKRQIRRDLQEGP
jgi:hypothetical protein